MTSNVIKCRQKRCKVNKNLIRWAKEKLPIVIADNSTEDLQQITSARQWSIYAGVGTHVVSNQILNEGKASADMVVKLCRVANLDVLEALIAQGLFTKEEVDDFMPADLTADDLEAVKLFQALRSYGDVGTQLASGVVASLKGHLQIVESSTPSSPLPEKTNGSAK